MELQEITVRLIFSALFGGILGYSRERVGKAAGLRTHILVSIGSTLFMIVSIEMARYFPGSDASRIAASVVTGIGFIGAGAIFQAGETIKGVTTAASIWLVSAVGLAVGAGLLMVGFIATVIGWIVLSFLSEFEKRIRNSD